MSKRVLLNFCFVCLSARGLGWSRECREAATLRQLRARGCGFPGRLSPIQPRGTLPQPLHLHPLNRDDAVVAPPSRRLTPFKWGGASTFASSKKSLNGEPKVRVRIDLTDCQRREPPGRRRSGNCIVPAEVGLTLHECVTRVVERNETVQMRMLERERARRRRPGEKGIFGPELVAPYELDDTARANTIEHARGQFLLEPKEGSWRHAKTAKAKGENERSKVIRRVLDFQVLSGDKSPIHLRPLQPFRTASGTARGCKMPPQAALVNSRRCRATTD